MAENFMTPTAQPGDGAWLLRQGSKRRGGGRKKLRSFLRQDPDEYEQDEIDHYGAATNQLASFLPSTVYPPTSLVQTSAEPRTIADEKLLSTRDQGARAPPPPSSECQPASFLFDQSTPKYTVEHQQFNAANMLASAVTLKGVPPHMRNRPASTTSNQQGNSSGSAPALRTVNDTIREKLASDFGVKVSDPQPLPTLVAYPASKDNLEDVNPKPVGKQAGDAIREVEQTHGAAGRVKGQAHSKDSRTSPPVYRGRGRDDGIKAAPRESRWPKKSDQKADSNRWVTVWGSEKSFGSSIDSAQADGGFSEDKKKRARTGGNDFELTDWNGGWAPAPIDWDARPAFRDSTKLSQIEHWMDKIDEEMCGITRELPIEKVTAVNEEVLPRYWVPIAFPRIVEYRTSMAPQTFWNEIIKSTPEPMHEHDLDGVRPWWELFTASDSVYLISYVQPAIKGIDPDENRNERLARENDHGADSHAQNRKRTEQAKRDAQRERRKKLEEKARKFGEGVPLSNRERVKPGLNIFVRSARPADMTQLRDIYNHYVDFTCCTPEMERRTTGDMTQRYNDILANRLPFLVACERGGKVPNRRKKRNPEDDLILPDRVVGFAFADDYNDMTGMYRFTAEVEFYTHKQHYMQSIAKCLMDKLMAMLDPVYVERGGFDTQGEELEGIGPSRVIQNLIINVPFDAPERLEWKGRWLSSWLGFEQKGLLEDIGHKNGKSVSLAIFKRKTGATVDAANPPIAMGYPS